ELIGELRRQNNGAPVSEILKTLPMEQRAAVEQQLASMRANPEHVSHAQDLLKAQDNARLALDDANKGTDEHAKATAKKALGKARQQGLDAIVRAHGIDDSQVNQRRASEKMGYGVMAGQISPSDSTEHAMMQAYSSGHIDAPQQGHPLFYDVNGNQHSVGYV